jgi:hypothetical protein
MHKERVHPNDTTLIEAMEAMIDLLGQLEQEALRMSFAADLGRDDAVLAKPYRSLAGQTSTH